MNNRRYSKTRKNPNKGEKITWKSVVVEEADVEELVETNQLLTNMNNLLEPLTISINKVELIELPKDLILPTGFMSINLSILSDVFF